MDFLKRLFHQFALITVKDIVVGILDVTLLTLCMFEYVMAFTGDKRFPLYKRFWPWLGFISTLICILRWSPVFLRIVYQWWYREYIAAKAYQDALKRLPESTREGSSYSTVTPPKFVVGVYGVTKGRKVFLGTGWASNDYIFTASHVVNLDYDEIVIKNHMGLYLPAPSRTWKVIGTDIAVTRNLKEWQIPNTKIDVLQGAHFVTVYSAQENNNCSMGILKHTPEAAYGSTSYEGSTRAGFSGAPYYDGHRVRGMHVGGGNTNYGFSASYLATLLRRIKKPESSDLDQIREALRTARRKDVEVMRGLDETEVRVGGRYFILDNMDMDELYDDQEFEDLLYEELEEEVGGKKQKRPRYRTARKEDIYMTYEDEPEYIPECSNVVDASTQTTVMSVSIGTQTDNVESKSVGTSDADFCHEPMSPIQKDSSDMGLATNTVCQDMSTISTPDTAPAQPAIIAGQQELLRKLNDLLVSMQVSGVLPCGASNLSQLMNTNTPLEQSPVSTELDSGSPRCTTSQSSIDGSAVSCGPSIPKAQQASGTSKPTRPLVQPWDTMDSDLQKLIEFRSSVDVSSPDYVHLRARFLNTLHLTDLQKMALIARLRNQKNRQQVKRMKLMKQAAKVSSPTQTPSSSS